MEERDIEADPYSKDEQRIAEFLFENGTGGGNDPVGSLIASHRYSMFLLDEYSKEVKRMAKTISDLEAARCER